MLGQLKKPRMMKALGMMVADAQLMSTQMALLASVWIPGLYHPSELGLHSLKTPLKGWPQVRPHQLSR